MFPEYGRKGQVSWVGKVKELLLKQGFGEVWYNQGVGDEKKFLRTFSRRLKDCFGQSWHDKLESSGRYPLAVSSQIRSIKYWLRLLKLNQDRLSFGAYRCSQNMAERGKVSWAGKVKELLLKQGFGE